MLAFTFPGQGSQRAGMGAPWVDHPSWEIVADASEVAGRDLAWLLTDAPAQELTATRNSQMATFLLSMVALDAVERLGITPSYCAGHSLGEYSALVATGAMSFEEGVGLVAERGDAMQVASEEHPGTMAAVLGADAETVSAACQRALEDVWVANDNAPGQCVIAGSANGVAAAGELAREMGAKKVLPLPVGGAFHTPYMAPARDRLRKALREVAWQRPAVGVVANVDARLHGGAVEWEGLLAAQLCSPVRWRQSMRTLAEAGASALVEVGPGGVLTGLARRSVAPASVGAIAVAVPEDLDVLMAAIAGDLAHHRAPEAHQGERPTIADRVVVSPRAGIFRPDENLAAATAPAHELGRAVPEGGDRAPAVLAVGDRIGTVGNAEVRTPFAGRLLGLLTIPGERVSSGQPVAWLRSEPSET